MQIITVITIKFDESYGMSHNLWLIKDSGKIKIIGCKKCGLLTIEQAVGLSM